ncbi:MAG: hypothetical protein CSA97_01155 [Bacteroidetes bacterium]|nr:MAG: hypothetical protein CSA97_01155 [Bacteroidota bacterium]
MKRIVRGLSLVALSLLVLGFTACDKDEVEKAITLAKMQGKWEVKKCTRTSPIGSVDASTVKYIVLDDETMTMYHTMGVAWAKPTFDADVKDGVLLYRSEKLGKLSPWMPLGSVERAGVGKRKLTVDAHARAVARKANGLEGSQESEEAAQEAGKDFEQVWELEKVDEIPSKLLN